MDYYNPKSKQIMNRNEIQDYYNASIPQNRDSYEFTYIDEESQQEVTDYWYKIVDEYPVHSRFEDVIRTDTVEEVEVEGVVTYKRVYNKVARNLDQCKREMLNELSNSFVRAQEEAHLTSAVGFEIDANETAFRNISGLISVTDPGDTVQFCDYNNEFHEVGLESLQIMNEEIIRLSQRLYNQKWAYRDSINNATDIAALEAIEIQFVYTI